jgi:CRISPR-associated endonuclease Cas1
VTALHTLARPPIVEQIPKHGILVMSGFGLRLKVQHGHLSAEWGIGAERHHVRLPRVNRNLRRVIIIGSDGFATFDAIRWITDIGASLIFLDRRGTLLFAAGPTAPSDARLRRAQSLALGNGLGLEISCTLIDAKLQGQERLVRDRLKDSATAQAIAALRERLPAADTAEVIRNLEAQAAVAYFASWRNVPVLWPKADLRRVPEHWRAVGNRHSPLSGGPRLAITPVHAILNYSFALLESETRLALTALGLDPGLGLGLHTDTPNRDSLALDVLEPVRPQVEEWLLSWIMQEPLRRTDFFETTTGNCRLMSHLCAKLSETAPVWGKLVAPWAEYVARALWGRTNQSSARRRLSTPLTQQHRREAKGRPSFPKAEVPRPDRLCLVCGKKLRLRNRRFCMDCSVTVTRENFDVGRKAAQRPEFLAKRSDTQRAHKQAIQNWKPGDLPAWLTRDVYVKQVQPALASVAKSQVRSALGVSEPYSSDIQSGKRVPHPRHWEALAKLVGVSARMPDNPPVACWRQSGRVHRSQR